MEIKTAQPLALPETQPQKISRHGAAPDLRAQAEDAADQFETLMALQMVRSMQSSLEGGSLMGDSTAGNIYNGLAEWELARILARGSDLGLKKQILRQLPEHEERRP